MEREREEQDGKPSSLKELQEGTLASGMVHFHTSSQGHG